MPRTARASAANVCYHVLNRGNNRARVFHKDGDFQAFVDLLSEAKLRRPMRVLAYCVMPNHFHLVLWPLGDAVGSRRLHPLWDFSPPSRQRGNPHLGRRAPLVLEKRILPMFSNSL